MQKCHARARWLFIQYLCWLVVTDQVSPLDGAKRLERIHFSEPPEVVELGHISGLVDEWEGEWVSDARPSRLSCDVQRRSCSNAPCPPDCRRCLPPS